MKKSQLRQTIRQIIKEEMSNQTIFNLISKNRSGEFIDIEKLHKILYYNYNYFKDIIDEDEFVDYLDPYEIDVSKYVGDDFEAYRSISLEDILKDFKTWLEREKTGQNRVF